MILARTPFSAGMNLWAKSRGKLLRRAATTDAEFNELSDLPWFDAGRSDFTAVDGRNPANQLIW